jgi:ribose transport system permease protein
MTSTLDYQSPLDTSSAATRFFTGIIRRIGRRQLGMLAALFVLCMAIGISNPDSFLKLSNITNLELRLGMIGILAIGSAFVIITGGIDLSVGSLVGLTGVILAKLSSSTSGGLGYSFAIGIPVTLGIILIIGLCQGLLITRLQLQPFIVTLGGMLMLRGVSQTIVEGGTIGFGQSNFRHLTGGNLFSTAFTTHLPSFLGASLRFLIDGRTIPYAFWAFLIVIAIATYLLHFTVFGRYIYAIGGSRNAAAYSGIPVKRVEATTYVISAGMAGLAGIFYAAFNGEQSQNNGLAYELYAIAACVLGGCSLLGGEGTILGVIIGAALFQIIDNGLNLFHLGDWVPNENWRLIVIGGVILIAVILDQVIHIAQARRRTRHVASPGAAK